MEKHRRKRRGAGNKREGEKRNTAKGKRGKNENGTETGKWRRTEEVIVYKCKKPKLFRAGCSPQPLTQTAVI